MHIWLLHRITSYQRRYKITSLDIIEFIDTHACINNPHWQSSGIIILLCKYDIVISDTLVGSFLDALFLFFAVILSELHEKPRRRVTEKSSKKNLCEGHHVFWVRALLTMSSFVAFFVYSLPLTKWGNCWMTPIKIHNIAMAGILCDDIMSELSKISLVIWY